MRTDCGGPSTTKKKKRNEEGEQRERKRNEGEGGERMDSVAQFTAVPCVFGPPNETVVILWLASALERYTGGMESLARIAKQQYRPLCPSSGWRSPIFAPPAG